MRVLMFGWEFSPFKSGGLGTACQGMATALAKKGTEIFFVLPRAESDRPVHLPDGLTMFSASGTRVCTRSARLPGRDRRDLARKAASGIYRLAAAPLSEQRQLSERAPGAPASAFRKTSGRPDPADRLAA